MAKTTLKNTRRQAAVKVVGTGSETIYLDDLLHADQMIDWGNVRLTITDILISTGDTGNITRNGNTVFTIAPGAYQEFNLTRSIGISLGEDSSSNVVINLGDTESSVILQFSKEAGFLEPNQLGVIEGIQDYSDPEYSE